MTYYRFIFWKSGKVTLEHQLTCGCLPTGIWMDTGTYNTVRGARIAAGIRHYNIHERDIDHRFE